MHLHQLSKVHCKIKDQKYQLYAMVMVMDILQEILTHIMNHYYMQDIYNGQAGFTNATGVDDAIKFVSQKFKENLKPNSASRDDKE
jgi:hypothetical protein